MFLASDLYRCMFVIGMDPQMIAAALEASHSQVLDQLPSYERAVPLGWRFMDKFIQLPFTIPPSNSESLRDFVTELSPKILEKQNDKIREDKPDEQQNTSASAEIGLTPEPESMVVENTDDLPSPEPYKADQIIEGRDISRIITEVSAFTAGNPREIKRMANLARLYLQLRNVRRANQRTWTSPELDQYARWIALASRWPDMMRWLLWGTDEAPWKDVDLTEPLGVRRLKCLEQAAGRVSSPEKWQTTVARQLNIPKDKESDWVRDIKLYEFFREEMKRPESARISSAARQGFW